MDTIQDQENTPEEFNGNLTKEEVGELTQELIKVTSQNPPDQPNGNINATKELNLLQSYNTPGTSKGVISSFARRRAPSLTKAKLV